MGKIKYVLFFVVLIMLLWVVVPTKGIPIKTSLGQSKIDKTLTPPVLKFKLFGREISKNFETQLGLDLRGGSHLVFNADMADVADEDRPQALESARTVIERRINFFGVSEPNVQAVRSGEDYRIVVDLPGATETSSAVALIGQTARLDFMQMGTSEAYLATDAPAFTQLTEKTGLTGEHIKRSSVQFDDKGQPAVSLEFNAEGSKLFEEITASNINKPVGIFLDGAPLSTPIVQQKITGGEAIISGNFDVEAAKQLSIAINSGALPVSVKLVEERSIGPTLGEQQVQNSIFAGTVGLLAVICFMILFYGRLGIIATIALSIYGLISLVLFKFIPVVLTLPGIAGFILSIGMAVDSNILIFERIKEEQRSGKNFEVAKRIGFGRAIDAIKDANFTTLLVAFILFNPLNWSFFPQFGLIKGFALTLAVGVATSLFTGVFITRHLLNIFYREK